MYGSPLIHSFDSHNNSWEFNATISPLSLSLSLRKFRCCSRSHREETDGLEAVELGPGWY